MLADLISVACMQPRTSKGITPPGRSSPTGNALMPLSKLQHIGSTFWNTLFSIDQISVCKYLQSLVTEWFQLGESLEFPHSTLRTIEADYCHSVTRQKEEMITEWLNPLLSPSTQPSPALRAGGVSSKLCSTWEKMQVLRRPWYVVIQYYHGSD